MMPTGAARTEDSATTAGAATSSETDLTPTQSLRDKLATFRFNEDLSPSLRRSPRTLTRRRSTFQVEDEDDVLPSTQELPEGSQATKRPWTPDEDASFQEASPKKRKSSSPKKPKQKVEVAPPEKYAHLRLLNDHLGDNPETLDVMFCGINPGQLSATVGHHFAHKTNHFWRCLHGAQLTDKLVSPTEDHTLPDRYHLGLTNLVERPSAQAAELAHAEYTAGVPALLQKVVRKRPRFVCFVGKAIWDSFIRAAVPRSTTMGSAKARKQAKPDPVVYDMQPYKVVHTTSTIGSGGAVPETLFFVVVSTSGLVASHQLPDKIKQFTLLKQRVDELKNGALDTSSMTVISVPSDRMRPL